MKRIALALCFILGTASGAAAQGMVAKGEIAVGGGVSFPLDEDFRDVADTGLALDVRGGYYVTPRHVVGAEFAWLAHPGSAELEDAASSVFGFPIDFSFDTFLLSPYFKFLFVPKPVTPYVKVHAGIYRMRLNVEALGERDSDSMNDLGLGGGLGVQFKSSGAVGGFVEGIWHVDFTDDSATSIATVQAGLQVFLGSSRAQ